MMVTHIKSNAEMSLRRFLRILAMYGAKSVNPFAALARKYLRGTPFFCPPEHDFLMCKRSRGFFRL